MPARQLHLGAFMRPASIHAGAWRYPGAWPDMNFNFERIKQSIQTLERAKFDAFFMADHLAVLNMPRMEVTDAVFQAAKFSLKRVAELNM